MSRFRETLWFKKGTEAPPAAETVSDIERPIEDRYVDDGTLSPVDSAAFSVKTGVTQPIRFVAHAPDRDAEKAMQAVMLEMKGSRGTLYVLAGASMVFVGAVIALVAM